MPGTLRVWFVPLALSGGVVAQVGGNCFLDKTVFPPGQPIFLHFQTADNGSRRQRGGGIPLYLLRWLSATGFARFEMVLMRRLAILQ